MKKQTGTAFNGAAGLQKNVDFPVKLQDKVCCTPQGPAAGGAPAVVGVDAVNHANESMAMCLKDQLSVFWIRIVSIIMKADG